MRDGLTTHNSALLPWAMHTHTVKVLCVEDFRAVLCINILLSIVLPQSAAPWWGEIDLLQNSETIITSDTVGRSGLFLLTALTHSHTNAASLKMHGRLWSWQGPERQLNLRDSGVPQRNETWLTHWAEVMELSFQVVSFCVTEEWVTVTCQAGMCVCVCCELVWWIERSRRRQVCGVRREWWLMIRRLH